MNLCGIRWHNSYLMIMISGKLLVVYLNSEFEERKCLIV